MQVDKDMQELLKNTFPCVSTTVLFDDSAMDLLQKNYEIKFVSVFDHWLTEAECDQITMCFAQFKDNGDDAYLERESRFMRFYESLFHQGVYYWEENKEFTVQNFKNFDNKAEYLEKCLDSIREKKFLNICVPNLHTIVCGGFDLTQRLLIRKGKSDSNLIQIIKDNDLYILS